MHRLLLNSEIPVFEEGYYVYELVACFFLLGLSSLKILADFGTQLAKTDVYTMAADKERILFAFQLKRSRRLEL